MSRTIIVLCTECGAETTKERKEITRRNKQGKTNFFCGLSCVASWKNKNRSPEEQKKISQKLSERLKGNIYCKKGNFTYYLNKAKNRKHDFDLDEEYISNVWDNQKGKCKLTGIQMTLRDKLNTPFTASLDRINSKKGYIKGNVQFVTFSANLAKNKFSDDEIVEFFQSIK